MEKEIDWGYYESNIEKYSQQGCNYLLLLELKDALRESKEQGNITKRLTRAQAKILIELADKAIERALYAKEIANGMIAQADHIESQEGSSFYHKGPAN